MFKIVLEKFEKYLDKMEAEQPPNFNMFLAIEVRKRIQQLEYFYKGIEEKHERLMTLTWRKHRDMEALRKRFPYGSITIEKSEESLEIERLSFEIEAWTESFYYLAGRMRTVLRHSSKTLAGASFI